MVTALDILGGCDSNVFFVEAHQHLWTAMRDLFEDGRPIDPVSIMSKLDGDGVLDRIGGIPYVSSLTSATPTSVNIESYCHLVLKAHQARELISIGVKAVGALYEKGAEPIELRNDWVSKLEQVDQSESNGVVSLSEMRPWLEQELEAMALDRAAGLRTGWPCLDRNFPAGIEPETLTVVGAMSSDGKSTFLLNLALNVCRAGGVVLLSSAEDSRQKLMKRAARAVCARAEFMAARERRDRVAVMRQFLGRLNVQLFVDDQFRSIEQWRFRVRNFLRKHPDTAFIGLDYLQLVQTQERGLRDERQRTDYKMDVINKVRKETGIPVVLLSQFNRQDFDRNENKGPHLKLFKESSRIEQDADNALLIWNNSVEWEREKPTFVRIAKQRDGPRKKCTLLWIPEQYLMIDTAYENTGTTDQSQLFVEERDCPF